MIFFAVRIRKKILLILISGKRLQPLYMRASGGLLNLVWDKQPKRKTPDNANMLMKSISVPGFRWTRNAEYPVPIPVYLQVFLIYIQILVRSWLALSWRTYLRCRRNWSRYTKIKRYRTLYEYIYVMEETMWRLEMFPIIIPTST